MAIEKLKRGMSVGTYAMALLLTIVIFSLGIYVGMVIDESAKANVDTELRALEQDLYLSRIMLLMEENASEFCPIYSEKLEAVDGERQLIGDRLEYLETVRGVYDEELKERYFYLELENYLLMERMEAACGADFMPVLFFYERNSQVSLDQGDVLDQLRAAHPEVKVFSFDGGMDSTVVRVLKEKYLINSYPTIVLDGKRLVGFQTLEQLEKKLQ
ncbi:MAG: hypothetical protein QXH30_02130 [Candidatus Bilamarchaeaceae archaeon]